MNAENLNKRGNPCGLCGKHHGAGPCQHTLTERERQLTEALHRIAHSGGGTFETVDGLRMIALDALDSTQTHGNEEWPEGWPDKCANCGADWTQISYDHALGFNCQSCGGSDADE